MTNRKAPRGPRYEPVPVRCIDAPADAVQPLLREFIRRYVSAARRGRWVHCLLDEPVKAASWLRHFAADRAEGWIEAMPSRESFPQRLMARLGDIRGVYFEGPALAVWANPGEAATLATENGADAIWCADSGGLALVFSHDDGPTWLCRAGGAACAHE